MRGRVASVLGVAFFLCFSSTLRGQGDDPAALTAGQDLAALKASFNAGIEALNSHQLDAALASTDDRMVLFGIFSPFPIEGKEGFRQAVQEYFENYQQALITPMDPEFKIIGTTGVAWGNFRLATRRKDGPQEYSDGRYMFTYTRGGGQWRVLSMHYSLLEPLVR